MIMMFVNQLCLGIIASGVGFVLRPADVFCTESEAAGTDVWTPAERGYIREYSERACLAINV